MTINQMLQKFRASHNFDNNTRTGSIGGYEAPENNLNRTGYFWIAGYTTKIADGIILSENACVTENAGVIYTCLSFR